jgi:hypothetical protein
VIRLVGAVLAEQHDDWAEGRRYLGLDVLAKSRLALIHTPTDDHQKEDPNTRSTHCLACCHRHGRRRNMNGMGTSCGSRIGSNFLNDPQDLRARPHEPDQCAVVRRAAAP